FATPAGQDGSAAVFRLVVGNGSDRLWEVDPANPRSRSLPAPPISAPTMCATDAGVAAVPGPTATGPAQASVLGVDHRWNVLSRPPGDQGTVLAAACATDGVIITTTTKLWRRTSEGDWS